MAQGSPPYGSGGDAAQTASVLQVQHQIRANAAELQDYVSDLYAWEKAISKEDAQVAAAPTSTPASLPRPRAHKTATVQTQTTTMPTAASSTPKSQTKAADAHTYDKGYQKWNEFDVEAALREADGEPTNSGVQPERSPPPELSREKIKKAIAGGAAPAIRDPSKTREDIDREEGNEHYRRGDYTAAIKSYTRCLGFNCHNAVVLSNRAMAYIKNREFGKAEDDCTLALKVDPMHVKSYSRRGTARNALGKHRLALLDFQKAADMDPKSKQIASQVSSTKELMRAAIKRSPKRTSFDVKVVGDIVATSAPEASENPTRTQNSEHIIDSDQIACPSSTVGETTVDKSQGPSSSRKSQRSIAPPLPRLPKKIPTTSYEFCRVWKSLAPKGDPDRQMQLFNLRASYLRMVTPTLLPSIFKTSIEADLLCELFVTIRQAFDITGDDRSLVEDLVLNLPRVPRFNMTVMFLSDKDKAECSWVFEQLLQGTRCIGTEKQESLYAAKALFGL